MEVFDCLSFLTLGCPLNSYSIYSHKNSEISVILGLHHLKSGLFLFTRLYVGTKKSKISGNQSKIFELDYRREPSNLQVKLFPKLPISLREIVLLMENLKQEKLYPDLALKVTFLLFKVSVLNKPSNTYLLNHSNEKLSDFQIM